MQQAGCRSTDLWVHILEQALTSLCTVKLFWWLKVNLEYQIAIVCNHWKLDLCSCDIFTWEWTRNVSELLTSSHETVEQWIQLCSKKGK